MTLFVHILAGGLGLVLGAVALAAAKGGFLHRRAGMLFVYAMLTMTLGGFLIAAIGSIAPNVNIAAALITAYLVVTGLLAVRPPAPHIARWLQPLLMLVALAVGAVQLVFAFEAVGNGGVGRDGMPAFPYFLFGSVGLLAAGLDVRMMLSGGLHGVARLTRHLWRMTFALWIATMSFFLGQQDEFPEALRIPALLALPVVTVLVMLLYWLWRVRRPGFRIAPPARRHRAPRRRNLAASR